MPSKLSAREFLRRITTPRSEDPPPPYSPRTSRDTTDRRVSRSPAPRQLPIPPVSPVLSGEARAVLEKEYAAAAARTEAARSAARNAEADSSGSTLLSPLRASPTLPPPVAPAAIHRSLPTQRDPSPSATAISNPSPAYSAPAAAAKRTGPASLRSLPVALLHRILLLALDPRSTPDAWAWDVAMERTRRLHWLFRDVRAVDRQLFLLATSILRERMLPTYTAHLQVQSSDPLLGSGSADRTSKSVFAQRGREAAVLDRFVAMRLGEDLRRAESELCEDSGEEEVLFSRLQPAARIEDLLLDLPSNLISSTSSRGAVVEQRLPLPHAHVAITLSPLWAQLWVSYIPINPTRSDHKSRAGRSMVVEIRKAASPEQMVRDFGRALEWLRKGRIAWGWSFREST